MCVLVLILLTVGQGGHVGPTQEEQEEAKRAADEQRQAMLVAVLQPAARERCRYYILFCF